MPASGRIYVDEHDLAFRVPLWSRIDPDGICRGTAKRVPLGAGLRADILEKHKEKGYSPPRWKALVRVKLGDEFWFGWVTLT